MPAHQTTVDAGSTSPVDSVTAFASTAVTPTPRRVDRRHGRGDVLDSGRVEHIAKRDAARRQVGLIVADPDVVVGLRTQHRDPDVVDPEFVEPPRRTERRPQPGETRAEYHDFAH